MARGAVRPAIARIGLRAAVAALVTAVPLLLAGCSTLGLGGLTIGLDNQTDRTLNLFINDQWVATYPPRSSVEGAPVVIPGPPWHVEARLTSGTVLVATDLVRVPPAGQGVGAAMTYDCGRVILWGGDSRPPARPPDFIDWAPPCGA